MKKAIITGITGQVGSFLAELLLEKCMEVYGIIRRSSSFNTQRIEHIYHNPNLHLVYGDLSDVSTIRDVIAEQQPDYFFNLGAQSFVQASFQIPEYTADIDGLGVMRCLEAVRKYSPKTRFYTASTSELYGSTPPPQRETTPFHPRSPYGVAKLMGYWSVINYREAYNLFACNGIVFNNESTRRGETFVTRKITRALGRIKYGLQNELRLGNIESKRDWGHTKDHVRGMLMILEHSEPDDFVIGTGKAYSVREFLEKAANLLDIDPYKYLVIDPKYFRPAEVNYLLADPTKAKTVLGWEPKITFDELVKEMVEYDLELARKEALLAGKL